MDKVWWMWLIFFSVVLILLILDLGVLHKKQRAISVKESLCLSAFYITISLLFGLWIRYSLGSQSMSEYYTGFLVEKSLALDNIFVISLIFSYLQVPRDYQHRVLFWGILGAILMRGLMISCGAALLSYFSWMLYLFATFLVFIGVKMLVTRQQQPNIGHNHVLQFLKKHWRMTDSFFGKHFFIKAPHQKNVRKSVYWITPLFVALILIEIADLVFAVDSIPAIFAITTDPYIVYTSNIFAILGLRAIYFALDAILYRFKYLQYALAMVLIFIGGKVLVTDWFGLEKFPALLSLLITSMILLVGIIFSLLKTTPKILK